MTHTFFTPTDLTLVALSFRSRMYRRTVSSDKQVFCRPADRIPATNHVTLFGLAHAVHPGLTESVNKDIINDRLDDAGPLKDGRRLGLRLITPEHEAAYLEGHQARDLLTAANTPAAFSFVSNRLVVMKEAMLDFARRHELPPPSWWIQPQKRLRVTASIAGDESAAIKALASHLI